MALLHLRCEGPKEFSNVPGVFVQTAEACFPQKKFTQKKIFPPKKSFLTVGRPPPPPRSYAVWRLLYIELY